MPQLKTLPWWPTAWIAETGDTITPEEIRKNGVLINVRRFSNALTLVVDVKGATCKETVGPALSEDRLILLRHILLQHYGEPMEAVEDLDIDLQGVFPVVK